MAQQLEKARIFHRFAGRTFGRFMTLVKRTSRIVYEPADSSAYLNQHAPAIVALWHGQFLLSTRMRPADFPLRIILAKHGDAEVFAQALAGDDIPLIRGAGAGGRQKDRGGAQAMRGLLRALKEGASIGMTADMPPGPARRSGKGIVTIARLSGRPIIPMAVASSRYISFNTWSRMTINLPFSRLAVVYGEPICVPRELDDEMLDLYRRKVEDGLNKVTLRAYELAGADPARATPPEPGTMIAAPPKRRKVGVGMRAYYWGTRACQMAAPMLLGYRERQGREDPVRRGERLGIARCPRPAGQLVWLHAASVGEVNAILPLMERIRQERPGIRFLLTTGTVTSAALAAARLEPDDIHQYVPLDTPDFVARFLDHWCPDVAVFTESEIWPNLVWGSSLRSIPLVLVNARMSSRSFDRWKKLRRLSRLLFSRFDIVLAQNETLARRFRELGARKVRAVGNLKMDAPPPPVDPAARTALRSAVGARTVFLAASTHPGEERQIGDVHRRLAQQIPGLLTIIAPRHPERGTGVAEELKELGLTVALRSTGALPVDRTDVYVADTIGELGTFYALAPVAFIGGSLVAKGGQNPIEAIRHGACVLMGPHWFNFQDACRALLDHGGMIEVRDANQLAVCAAQLYGDEAATQKLRAQAGATLEILAGALDESVAAVTAFIPETEEFRRAS